MKRKPLNAFFIRAFGFSGDRTNMRFRHTNRKGFWLGFIDFFTAGLFFLLYMPLGGLQNELEQVLGHKLMPYWKAYLLGIPTLFIYPLIWMSRIAEELKKRPRNSAWKGRIPPGGTCSAGTPWGSCSSVRPLRRTASSIR